MSKFQTFMYVGLFLRFFQSTIVIEILTPRGMPPPVLILTLQKYLIPYSVIPLRISLKLLSILPCTPYHIYSLGSFFEIQVWILTQFLTELFLRFFPQFFLEFQKVCWIFFLARFHPGVFLDFLPEFFLGFSGVLSGICESGTCNRGPSAGGFGEISAKALSRICSRVSREIFPGNLIKYS